MRLQHCLPVLLLWLPALFNTATAQDDDNPVTTRFKCRSNGCCDHHEWCRFWASVGECRTNAEWMEDNCQLACGTCKKMLPKILARIKAQRNNGNRSSPPGLNSTGRRNPFMRPRPPVTRPPARQQQTFRPTMRPMPVRTFTRAPVTRRPPPPPPARQTVTMRTFPPRTAAPRTFPPRTSAPRTFQTRPPPTRPPMRRTRPTRPFVQARLQQTTTQPPRTTTRAPVTAAPFIPVQPRNGPTLSPAPPPNERSTSQQIARCLQLMRQRPENLAEMMQRERLVQPVEDSSGRRPLDLDTVVRSNIANACVPRNDDAECQRSACYHMYFRTMDGTCNNIANPLQGSAYRPYNRLLPPIYDNGLSEPVASLFPQSRPNPRDVTRTMISSDEVVLSTEYNALLMQFGQFTSHDMAKTTLVPSAKCNVCQNITSRCMAVGVSREDPNQDFKSNVCIRVSRSSPICGSGHLKPRQQLSENSGYIDASPIYGSSHADSFKFREGRTGRMKLPTFNGVQVPPFDQNQCRGGRANCKVIFLGGDSRVNLFVGLSSYHTLFTKEHNRIAVQLERLNPHWNGDRVYHESRKLVGAQIQAIVYREYLPKILGASFATTVGEYQGYDPNVDATIANEFTSGSFRFGHGMIQEVYQRLDSSFRNISAGALVLEHGTLKSDTLVFEGGAEPLIRGMMMQPVKRPQRITPAVTEKMFGSTDLSTINIQRGRDHGHPGYVQYRDLCGMGMATNFDQLSREILSTGVRNRLQRIYGTVDKIDLFVGGLMEDPVVRGLVGPTIACIIGPQFKRTRDGDRFYFENPGVFTRAQLAEIRKGSLSRIICDNMNIGMVPREAFRLGRLTPCNQIPQMDLSRWREL